MKNISIIAFLLFFALKTFAQNVSRINFEQIKAEVNSSGTHGWNRLTMRALSGDTSLTVDDYKYLYYGQVFQTGYSPLTTDTTLTHIKIVSTTNPKLANKLLGKYLQTHPVDLEAIYGKLILLMQLKETSEYKIWDKYYRGLIQAITSSGDGKTLNTAMEIVNVADQYKVLIEYRLTSESHHFDPVSKCDVQQLLQPNDMNCPTLYFKLSG